MTRRRPPTLAARRADAGGLDLAAPTGAGRACGWGSARAQALLLVGLLVIGLGPILWLAKSAITPTQDTITHPMALFPHGAAWSNLSEAWTNVDVGRYFWNTVVLALGSWLVADRRRDDRRLRALGAPAEVRRRSSSGSCSTTLFVPAVVLLVPLYIEIVHPPLIHHSFIDSYWAIWLPARRERVQRRAREALLRQPAARDLRGGADRRRGPVPPVLVDRAADVEADPRRRLGVRDARVVEGLPLAAARAHEPRQAAALGAPADDPGADRARRLPRRDVHRVPRPDRRLPRSSSARSCAAPGLGGAIKG